ncbi:MAG: restriction endonuclease subunit S [Thaumarchaeota archaeon]|nr:restriction endonuclease subunit S [Nitrososphaerota archaeon]
MSQIQIPKGWNCKSLGKIVNVKHGHQFRRYDFVTSDGYKICKIGQLGKDSRLNLSSCDLVSKDRLKEFSDYLIKKGDMLVSLTGDIGTVVKVDEDVGIVFQNYRVGKFSSIDTKQLRSDFLFYFLKSNFLKEQIIQKTNKAVIGNIGKSDLENMKIIFPTDTNKQKKIVQKLDYVLEKFEEKKKQIIKFKNKAEILELAKASESSILSKGCLGEFTYKWQKNEKNYSSTINQIQTEINKICKLNKKIRPELIKDAFLKKTDVKLGKIPESWNWVPLESICDPSRGITYGVIKLGSEEPDGIPCLRTSDVKKLSIKYDNIKRISKKIADKYKRTFLHGNELLVNIRGTLGGIAVVDEKVKGYNISREIALVPILKILSPQYFAYWIATDQVQRWFMSVKRGIAYQGINLNQLRKLPVPLPSLGEQKKIVSILQTKLGLINKSNQILNEINKINERSLHHLDFMQISILNQAFSGKLVN